MFIRLIASLLGATEFLQCGGEVGDEVVYVFDTDAETEHVRVYSCCNLLLWAKLRVCCRCRVNDERLGVSHAADMKDELELCDKSCRCLEASLYAESEYASETMLEIFASKLMILIALETRVVHALHCRVLLEKFRYGKCIVAAALCAE